MSLHVDDGVLAAPTLAHAQRVLGSAGLGATRQLTWGPLENTLGIDFKVSYSEHTRSVFMSQRSYAVTILERAGMVGCKPSPTPASANRRYTKDDCPATDEERRTLESVGHSQKRYHTVQASLNFLVSQTRDDLRFATGKTGKYTANPGLEHFKAQKHQLRFLNGTLGYGIEFLWRASDPQPVDGPLHITAYSDSSFADDLDTARTTLGTIGKVNGATVFSSSKLSQRIDSCVNHSELNAFDGVTAKPHTPTDGAAVSFLRASRTVVWMRGIKAGLERRSEKSIPPTPVFVDNTGVLSMLDGKTIKTANRHIYRSLAENRERVHLDKTVVPVKIDTKANLANAMTKQEHDLKASAAQLLLITGPPVAADPRS